ncbi:MAG: Rieske 2Fe-2S domain-containing protein [Dehalococcoidia bacterium]
MAEFVRVARLSDIPAGTMKGVKARGKEVLVANIDGEAYAVGDRCTHLRYRLHNGTLDGTVVTCQGHGSRFDVTDGGVCGWVTHPAWYRMLMDATFPGFLKRSLPSYPTRVEGDDVYVEL